eukprot:4510861-Prymnesium_polylepis.2
MVSARATWTKTTTNRARHGGHTCTTTQQHACTCAHVLGTTAGTCRSEKSPMVAVLSTCE